MNIVEKTIVCIIVFALLAVEESDALRWRRKQYCWIAGQKGVCKLSCASNTSFCVPNVTACTYRHSSAYCSISKPGVGFTKVNLTGISQSLVIDVIDPVENLTSCHNYCILKNICKAFALFESEENGNKTCRLMISPQFCSSKDPSPGLKLIEYFEIQRLRESEHKQLQTGPWAVRPVNVSWFGECWSQQCPIRAAVGFREVMQISISVDVDYIIGGTHSSDMILSSSGAVAMNVVKAQSRCPPNYLLTAIQYSIHYMYTLVLDYYKCLRLSDDWEIIDSECRLYENFKAQKFVCPPVNGNVSYVVGISQHSHGLSGITCCPVVKLQP